ncbi:DNA polymerase III, delta subunit [Clostridium pasteurianum DSM 525 = ATCC 6013]|uniref:DNA polymerase III subunit delta n=2 Tax=Clostridium pasteurianum TaxID=1501 RepID=A0A0H3J388_CLOPA|nr:DNA polymerase III subunit delta [Clostridium pasteurianum]AJA48391.1 DNA polymerase III, delta subunit [Clostridium pasteurianum DSM 525 = ATCC 6013]AJA52379.1 DNA polymerase III, delta subunit [Clostridium pasteurianum DSM 525 = ATCC 6013]AOZ75637.1 DNA polymerase III subunit delta [Clostridium pasteurianum DSM 525 = ATCC 6013]AOZ79433.1 DNA polymerase III subunit delta [Clostridium pasteurianum]ELP60459.1 DNA polymerase III subunit delta [Clostridium pasteurianum DSM 525 = ATCC 6013]
MINFLDLDSRIKKTIDNFYIFCGHNEQMIKDSIKKIVKLSVNNDFLDLNYFEFDGVAVTYEEIINSCETLPFMSDNKVIVVYRADFLSDRTKHINKNGDTILKKLKKYSEDFPKQSILIMYYVFDNDREKISSKVKRLDKNACVVEFTKLKGVMLQNKVKEIFNEKGKNIDRTNLSFFCSEVENNMDIIKNEVDKLCCYTEGRNIEKQDILDLLPQKSDNDIFNLVDFLSQRRPERAIEVLSELIYKGEKATNILSMIERQFRIMMNLKIGMENKRGKEELAKEYRLHPFICEKMMRQCQKYTLEQIIKSEEICIETERELKSQGSNERVKLELLIIKSAMV